jgi:FkbM family methyltransferase
MNTHLLAALMRAMPTHIRRFDAVWRSLYSRAGGGGYAPEPELDARWPVQLQNPVRLRSGFLAQLCLRDWLERRVYFSGLYYQHPLEMLLKRLLRPGDTWIDVGANIGLVTLSAAARIGQTGSGYCIEPNPKVFKRLTGHLSLNGIRSLKCLNLAVGDAPGEATLSVPEHTGQASLVESQATSVQKVRVPVVRADEILLVDERKALTIKIDVEGYELRVLRGMPRLLGHPNAAVIVEVVEEYQRHAGTTGDEILKLMESFGFSAFAFDVKTSRFSKSLTVTPLTAVPADYQEDVLFLKRGSALATRLQI